MRLQSRRLVRSASLTLPSSLYRRDYFLFIARKYGTQLFKLGGFEEVTDPKQAKIKMEPGWWKEWDKSKKEDGFDQPAVRWMEGRTGVPFIDANMVRSLSFLQGCLASMTNSTLPSPV